MDSLSSKLEGEGSSSKQTDSISDGSENLNEEIRFYECVLMTVIDFLEQSMIMFNSISGDNREVIFKEIEDLK